MPIGAHGPLYCGGAGKAILAYLSESDQEQVLAGVLEAMTPTTPGRPGTLRAELRASGRAAIRSTTRRWSPGSSASRCRSSTGSTVRSGAISVAGPEPKAAGPAVLPVVAMLNEAAGYVSRRLGYAGAWPPLAGEDAAAAPRGGLRMRVAWVMRLKPGNEAAYKPRHDAIWPEMLALMQRDGIRNFSIYRYGLLLFAYLERDTPPPEGPPTDPVIWRWWESRWRR